MKKILLLLVLISPFCKGQSATLTGRFGYGNSEIVTANSISIGSIWGETKPQIDTLKTEVLPETIEITYKSTIQPDRRISCAVYHGDGHCSWNDPIVRYYKEVYGARDGKIKLLETIEGNYIPKKVVVTEERIEFKSVRNK
ncbi:MAG: hypothetical protein V4714_08300 [Bacteroidota bacterium]